MMSKSSLCNYRDTDILVSGTITIPNKGNSKPKQQKKHNN